MSKNVLPLLSSSFMVSGLTFRSLIHLNLFLHVVQGECFNIIDLHEAAWLSQHHLQKYTHRYRKQIYGYQRGRGGGRKDKLE